MAERRIIQIAVASFPEGAAPDGTDYYAYARLYALCDDGSLWWKGSRSDNIWRRCAPVPQEQP